MMKQSRVLQILTSLFAASLLLSFTLMAMAQSGRRVVKPTQSTPKADPTTTSATVPKPTPSPEKLAPLATLIVGMDRTDAFSRIPLGATSGVLQNCVDRLDDSASVKVIVEHQSMGRGDAVRKAKSGKEGLGHVVYLQVALDRIGADQGATVDIRDVFIEYIVFAPGTAKIVTQGRTYPQAYRNRTGLPSPKTASIYGDYLYNQAAREAAERILSEFHIPTRPVKLP